TGAMRMARTKLRLRMVRKSGGQQKAATPKSEWPPLNSFSLWQRKHEHAVAALRVDLVVAARGDRDVLLAADHVGHGRCVDAGAAVVFPELLAGLGIERLEPAVGLAVEDEVAGGREHAADQRLWRLDTPCDLAGVEVDGDQTAPLLFRGNRLERAAEPQFSAWIWRRFDVIGHRLVQVRGVGHPRLRVDRQRRPLDAAVR